ncbi:MAG: hypothetical protein IJ859_08890 [Synergistaceae bacterium]|nr:hypothetical protein [Synergistaceae bacterium]
MRYSPQNDLATSAFALNNEDAERVLAIVKEILEDYDLPELTPEERAELDRLEADDTDVGVPFEEVLKQYGMTELLENYNVEN